LSYRGQTRSDTAFVPPSRYARGGATLGKARQARRHGPLTWRGGTDRRAALAGPSTPKGHPPKYDGFITNRAQQ